MQFQSARLQQNDAILFLLGIDGWGVGSLLARNELLFEEMGKELSHAFLVSLVLEVHVGHEALRLGVAVGALEEHSEVVNAAHVVFADVDDEARISLLLDCDLATLFLGPDLDARLGNLNLLFIQVASDFDGCIALLY